MIMMGGYGYAAQTMLVFARVKPFRLQKKPAGFFLFPKKTKCSKTPELQNLASKKPNWLTCYCTV